MKTTDMNQEVKREGGGESFPRKFFLKNLSKSVDIYEKVKSILGERDTAFYHCFLSLSLPAFTLSLSFSELVV